MQRRIERALLDQQDIVRPAFDVLGDLQSMGRTGLEHPQDQHVERASQQVPFGSCIAAPPHSRRNSRRIRKI